MSAQAQVVVLVEQRRGEVADVTLEMLALAHDLGRPVVALAVGAGDLAGQLPADEVLVVDGDGDLEPTLAALEEVVRHRQPVLVLCAHTARGMEVGPAAALDLGAPFVADCTGAWAVSGAWQVRRQMVGGRLEATITLKPAPTVVLGVRPGSVPALPASSPSTITPMARPDLSAARRRHLAFVSSEVEDIDIAAADILVAVGRGVGKPENIAEVEAFAAAIGATVACSRPVADAGWLPKSRQVGTSARRSSPGSTSPSASAARFNTRRACATPAASSRSTAMRARRSFRWPTTASWPTCSMCSRCSKAS